MLEGKVLRDRHPFVELPAGNMQPERHENTVDTTAARVLCDKLGLNMSTATAVSYASGSLSHSPAITTELTRAIQIEFSDFPQSSRRVEWRSLEDIIGGYKK
jgi:hypothetical protein